MLRYVLPCLLVPGMAIADDAREAFVEANLLGVFYHELGHALIDILQLPGLRTGGGCRRRRLDPAD